MNQFRNDGEMPPEIAAQFPIDDPQEQYDTERKAKPVHSHLSNENGAADTAGGCLTVVALILAMQGSEEAFFLFLGVIFFAIAYAVSTID